MLNITLPNGQVKSYSEGITLLEISKDYDLVAQDTVVMGIFNGEGVDLQKPLYIDGEAGFVSWDTEEGNRVYVRSLLFLFLYVVKKLRPEVQIEVCNSLGSALYCDIVNDVILSKYDLQALEAEMKRLVAEKQAIGFAMLPKKEAERILEKRKDFDRLELLCNIPGEPVFNIYSINDYSEYFFGALVPNCGYLKHFELVKYERGIVINYPETDNMNVLDKFEPSPKLNAMFHELQDWAEKINCNTVAKLNYVINQGHADTIVQVSEALHEKKIAAIADKIIASNKDVKLILIAGPSSSGKSSFIQRLSIQLIVNGIKPMTISMDDYYVERINTPRKPDGSYDYECVEAVDLVLFNDHLRSLLSGESVKIPKYNFRTGCREYRGKEIALGKNSVLLVEGIHGLNERISASVAAENKIKIYISALTPMQLDAYNRIHTTDMRLLRRMVRDSQFRSHDALMTLKLWQDVRQGEEKYIFPFQEDADIIFNTSLVYEFAVLKEYAEPLLKSVPRTESVYAKAAELLELLSHVKGMPIDDIPNNSILREFVGGSIFKDSL